MRWDSGMWWCMHAGQGCAVNQMPRCWPCGHALQPGRSASEAALQFSDCEAKANNSNSLLGSHGCGSLTCGEEYSNCLVCLLLLSKLAWGSSHLIFEKYVWINVQGILSQLLTSEAGYLGDHYGLFFKARVTSKKESKMAEWNNQACKKNKCKGVSVFCILRLLSAGVSCKDYSLPRLQRISGDLSGVLNKVLGYAYAGVNSSLKDRICLGKYSVSVGFDWVPGLEYHYWE